VTKRLLVQTLALSGILLAAVIVQFAATLYYSHADDIEWTLGQLTTCERSVPAAVRDVLLEERQPRIVPDTVDRLLADLDQSHRSAASRALKRWLWRWLLPQSLQQDDLLGLYLHTWPYPEGRGLCAAAERRYARPLGALAADELRALLAEEGGPAPHSSRRP